MPKIYTVEQKKQWVEEYRSGKSLKTICKEKVKIEDLKDDEFKPLIRAVFEKSEVRMSASGIRYRLKIDCHRISSKRVKRLMDEIGLMPVSAKETKYYYNPSSFGRKNKLKRRFNQTEPNKVGQVISHIFS